MIPEVRIKYGWLIDSRIPEEYASSLPEDKKVKWLSKEEMISKIEEYKSEWNKISEAVLKGMCEILDLEFKRNIIDCHIVNSIRRGFSDPLVLSHNYKPERFADILTHELLHILLTDNTKDVNVRKAWNEMFPEASDMTSRNHVLVHAVHKELLLNVLKQPERLERELRLSKVPGYIDAWNIVEKRGSKNIIEEFKKYY